jgi:2',3'-cyclic-nucleotide 2'-phosphodiesterase (5'-nucleotidase family)
VNLRRILPVLAVASLAASAQPSAAKLRGADQLVIVGTTDVKAKYSPCGCHVPKGGLSRQASYVDSVRAQYSQILWVDNGGFFPETSDRREAATFMMDMFHTMNLDAVGVGERELLYGAAFLKSEAARTGLPVTCANLLDAATKKPLLLPHVIKKVGTLQVGIFGLIANGANLGPAGDSLIVDDPVAAARRTTTALRKAGANVVVLLSQLGKIPSEELVASIDGIDVVMVGHDTPVLQKGRTIKSTVACYGGEQGMYMCRTLLTLGEKRHVVTGEAQAVMLSPEVGERPEILERVKAFEANAAVKATASAPKP